MELAHGHIFIHKSRPKEIQKMKSNNLKEREAMKSTLQCILLWPKTISPKFIQKFISNEEVLGDIGDVYEKKRKEKLRDMVGVASC